MKKIIPTVALACLFTVASTVSAQTTDKPMSTAPGVESAPAQMAPSAVSGLSIKDDVLGATVYNGEGKEVGDINDVIVTRDGDVGWYVVGAGGFLGMGDHNVAVPRDKIMQNGDKLILSGYTKEQIKDLPSVDVHSTARSN